MIPFLLGLIISGIAVAWALAKAAALGDRAMNEFFASKRKDRP